MILPFVTVIQGFVALVTGFLLVFFSSMFVKGHANWTVVYVATIEFITYICLLSGGEDVVLKVGESQQVLVWIRYASWFTTCPVLLQMMTRVVHSEEPTGDFTTKTIMCFIFTNVMGVTAAIQAEPGAKWAFFLAGIAGAAKLLHFFYVAWSEEVQHMEQESLSARYQLMILMCLTWTTFPLVFLLGPEMTYILRYEGSAISFAVLDLLCKNLFGFMCWHFNFRNAWSHSGFKLGLERKITVKREAVKHNSPRHHDVFTKAYVKQGSPVISENHGRSLRPSNDYDHHLKINPDSSQLELVFRAIAEQNSIMREMQEALPKA